MSFFIALRVFVYLKIIGQKSPYGYLVKFITQLINTQSIKRSFAVGQKHYDVGNNLYQKMLGDTLAYTCGYWKQADSLAQAQIDKFRLIGEKLMLKPGMKVLDIGCGFGTAMAFLAKEYEVEVVGVTISQEQVKYINNNYSDLAIKATVQDYRHIQETDFDRIYSIGMFEHVGYKNYYTYMQICNRLLKSDGLMLLHTIGNHIFVKTTNEWIAQYIFPNSMIPSLTQISSSAEALFVIEDVQNFGYDYDKTLMQWYQNFKHSWPLLSKHYDHAFYRIWWCYLLSYAGGFRSRHVQLFQLVMSPNGVEMRYDRPELNRQI